MSSCCAGDCAATASHFDVAVATRDLQRYRQLGPDVTTRLLQDGVRRHVRDARSLLDIGAGIGVLTFELLDEGVAEVIAVEASPAYFSTGRQESERRNRAHQVSWLQGNFVELGRSVSAADVVTLDRVVCCYPDVESLLREAAGHARRCLAFSYPRDRWYVRTFISAQNAVRRMKRSGFRTFVHPASAMEHLVVGQGFSLVSRQSTPVWSADVYLRTGADSTATVSGP